jgi:small multidrug resistance family-3 protein
MDDVEHGSRRTAARGGPGPNLPRQLTLGKALSSAENLPIKQGSTSEVFQNVLKSIVFLFAGLLKSAAATRLAMVRNSAGFLIGALGGFILLLYGIVPTYQADHFGRVYAAYGGWFVVLSILWGWGVDRVAPDRYDIVGAAVCLIGVAIIMYAPR